LFPISRARSICRHTKISSHVLLLVPYLKHVLRLFLPLFWLMDLPIRMPLKGKAMVRALRFRPAREVLKAHHGVMVRNCFAVPFPPILWRACCFSARPRHSKAGGGRASSPENPLRPRCSKSNMKRFGRFRFGVRGNSAGRSRSCDSIARAWQDSRRRASDV